jgi:hypothetical protein
MTDEIDNNELDDIALAIDAKSEKPRLQIEDSNPDATVAALRNILANRADLYERGVPARISFDKVQGSTVAREMTPEAIVLAAHSVCRPFRRKGMKDGSGADVDVCLPRSLAVMYLDWHGEWRLPPLNGITSSPLLRDDGTIIYKRGYDRQTGMFCENVPDLGDVVTDHPTEDDAAAALLRIRDTFKTFCFADSDTILTSNISVVDTTKPPGKDESAFLATLLTAVCRPSLHLAPGALFRAAAMSGSGAGKGLLVRCICMIANGCAPHAVTKGATGDELEKRIAAELIQGGPALFLDNLNNTALKSSLLASVITERPARIRLLGKSQMVPLNASVFVIITGNGISISEDHARRFITTEFDPRTEDPEARPFTTDILAEVTAGRNKLLADVLTIWRFGRHATNIKQGRPLGSFRQWCSWVRDPLLTLGCHDPAARVSEAKERDSRRQVIVDVFAAWDKHHDDRPVTANALHDEVKQHLDPQGRGRQFLASKLGDLTGTRLAGYVLTREESPGKWSAATYSLKRTDGDDPHRDHRGHESYQSDPTYAPYGNGGRRVKRCVQCNADGEPLYPTKHGNAIVYLHPECKRFWKAEH